MVKTKYSTDDKYVAIIAVQSATKGGAEKIINKKINRRCN